MNFAIFTKGEPQKKILRFSWSAADVSVSTSRLERTRHEQTSLLICVAERLKRLDASGEHNGHQTFKEVTMRTILNEDDRAAIVDRLRSLSAASTRRWGSMDVTGMLLHLRLSGLMALGELPVPSANKRVFQVFPLKHLILYVFPFPKGAPTAPELKPDVAVSLEEERTAVLELLERIGSGPHEGAGPAHPLFGPMSRREWGVATYKHTDHHLKQFGA